MYKFSSFLFLSAAVVSVSYGAAFALPAIPSAVSALKITLGATAATVGALASDKYGKVLSSSADEARVSKYDLTIYDPSLHRTDATVEGIVTRSQGLAALRENYGSSGLGSGASNSDIVSKALPNASTTTKTEAMAILGSLGSDWTRESTPQGQERKKDLTESSEIWQGISRASLGSVRVYADSKENACILAGGTPVLNPSGAMTSCTSGGVTLPYPRRVDTIPPSTGETDCYVFMGPNINGYTCGVPPYGTTEPTAADKLTALGDRLSTGALAESVPRSQAQTVPTTITVGDRYVTVNNNVITVSTTQADAIKAEQALAEEQQPVPEAMEDTVDFSIPEVESGMEYRQIFSFAGSCPTFGTLNFGRLGSYSINTTLMCDVFAGVGGAIVAAAAVGAIFILRG